MGKTKISIKGEDFYINGEKTYSNSPKKEVHGLLMNARFIQGILDVQNGREIFNRYGKVFDPEKNTDDLIAALPQWYRYGLRAFTVGLQGGGSCFTIEDCSSYVNNPFSQDGLIFDERYARRLDRLICAADEIGMAVIVNFFYICQNPRIKGVNGIVNALKTGIDFLKNGGYTNVMIDIANEHDNQSEKVHEIIWTEEGMALLIKLAKEYSQGKIPISCSFNGGVLREQVCQEADFILIHGNGCSRQQFYNTVRRAREYSPNKPVVCNEDSQAIGNMVTAIRSHVSWGYYNNITKQEPPANWEITKGEDYFFANRMAMELGLQSDPIPEDEQIYLQGLEKDMTADGKRWIRVASLYPERIDYVDFYLDGRLEYTCYDEPFSMYYGANWYMWPLLNEKWKKEIKAVVHMRDGRIKKFIGRKPEVDE